MPTRGTKNVNRSEWEDPTFIQSKNNRTVRILSNSRKPNQIICKKTFSIPKIYDMLPSLEDSIYTTSLDLNIGYYHIDL